MIFTLKMGHFDQKLNFLFLYLKKRINDSLELGLSAQY